jgi:N-acetyl-gamma-glutamylphosphate reductase
MGALSGDVDKTNYTELAADFENLKREAEDVVLGLPQEVADALSKQIKEGGAVMADLVTALRLADIAEGDVPQWGDPAEPAKKRLPRGSDYRRQRSS